MTHRVDPRNRRRPTYARREQLIEAIDGIAYRDPYRWLEDDSPEAIAWQDAENQRAGEFLSRLLDLNHSGRQLPGTLSHLAWQRRTMRADGGSVRLQLKTVFVTRSTNAGGLG